MTQIRSRSLAHNTLVFRSMLTFAACGAALVIVAAGVTVKPAAAYDDDVEVVCWDGYDGEIECMEVEDLAAECEMADPEYTSEQCAGLLEDRVPVNLQLITRQPQKPSYTYDAQYGGKRGGDREGGEPGSGKSNDTGAKGPND